MMASTWEQALVLICFILYQGVASCPSFDSRLSWSLPATVSASTILRKKRDVSLSDRGNCGDGPGMTQPVNRVNTTERVQKLLDQIQTQNLDAYIVPSSDEHLSEYIAEYDKRRRYISGFSGSEGTAVILSTGVRAVWTDGRYFLQADEQLDCNWLMMKEDVDGVPTVVEWLKASLPPNSVVGADPKLVSAMEWLSYATSLKEADITFKPIMTNLVDEIWPTSERPPRSTDPIEILELQFAGKKWEEKVADVREELKKHDADMIVITAMDEVAWLFNLRGGDVPYNPVFRSYVIIDNEKTRLFLDKRVGPELDLHLHIDQCDQECVEIHNYNTIAKTLHALSSLDSVKRVILPSKYSYSGGASYAIYAAVPKAKRVFTVSPVLMMKSRKNPVEKMGMRNAHVRDAVALIDFLSFLEEEIESGNSWTELAAAKRLEEFRSEQDHYHSLSFGTISAFGSNGAIIHYEPSTETDTKITDQSLFLLDSGGQYKDGTTDVTRTMHYGTPTDFQKEAYTRVLMGAIDVALVTFPKGTKDTRIDILARRALYDVGLDYKHGTGHGIGMFLNVHEAPIQIRIYGPEEHELEEGQFFSDEPGYYKAGAFGVRLETILTVVNKPVKYDDVPMFGMEPVTLVPFEAKLIDVPLLSRKQCAFLNLYHSRVRQTIGTEMDKQKRSRAKAYVMKRTEPIDCTVAGTKDLGSGPQIQQIFQQKQAQVQQAVATNSGPQKSQGFLSIFTVTVTLYFSFLLRR